MRHRTEHGSVLMQLVMVYSEFTDQVKGPVCITERCFEKTEHPVGV
jgi:hypothetical protein